MKHRRPRMAPYMPMLFPNPVHSSVLRYQISSRACRRRRPTACCRGLYQEGELLVKLEFLLAYGSGHASAHVNILNAAGTQTVRVSKYSFPMWSGGKQNFKQAWSGFIAFSKAVHVRGPTLYTKCVHHLTNPFLTESSDSIRSPSNKTTKQSVVLAKQTQAISGKRKRARTFQ